MRGIVHRGSYRIFSQFDILAGFILYCRTIKHANGFRAKIFYLMQRCKKHQNIFLWNIVHC